MSTPQITTYPIRVTSPESEVSRPFLQGMANRMSVSFHKYGLVSDAYPERVSALDSLEARVEKYRETGNTEWLIDAANFCLEPAARVWMADLTWKPLGQVQVGDRVVGFTEEAVTRKTQRAWRLAEVTDIKTVRLPRVEVELSNGVRLITSPDHRWLAAGHQGSGWYYKWLESGRDSRSGMRQHGSHWVPRIAPIHEPIMDYDSGWLAGFLDGEGHANQSGGRIGTLKVVWGQNDGVVRRHVAEVLRQRGYDVAESQTRKCIIGSVRGGIWESFRLLQEVRPLRLIDKLDPDRWGAVRQHGVDEVLAVRPLEDGPLMAMATTTGTFVAEGYGHHNCMIEFMCPSIDGAEFRATDSDEAIGRVTTTGETTAASNDEIAA